MKRNHRTLALSILPLILLGLLLSACSSGAANEANSQLTANAQYKVAIYMFWGDGCPHCAKAKPFLESLAENNPQVELRFLEVWNNETNQGYFKAMSAAFGFEPQGVPTIFIGEKHWVGYGEGMNEEITNAVNACLENGCPDRGVGVLPPEIAPPVETTTDPTPESPTDSGKVIRVPLLGEIDLSHQSLFVSTLLIAFVDGVNPCSIWVLMMLLSITLNSGSRKRVIIIGLVYLTVTALIYALFIAGLFSIFTVINFGIWIRIAVALIATFFALINIKDYFWYKEGVSFTISDKNKTGIARQIYRLRNAELSTGGLIAGAAALGAGVSLVEFSCTAGFPVLWTNLLTTQNVSIGLFIALLLVYMIIYQVDELAIFFTAVFTLKASRLEEKGGRILKLMGGTLMLSLAMVMLINPNLINNMGSALLIFGIALGVALLILLLHRRILPALGIHIGSEFKPKKPNKRRE